MSAEDRIAIRDLVDSYAQLIDTKDVDGALALFVPDASFRFYEPCATEPRTTHDLAQFRDALAVLDRHEGTMHVIASHTATVTGDTATGRTRCVAHHFGNGQDHIMYITYYDGYVRASENWRFGSRELHLDSSEDRPWQPT